jgi:hypothetical protein
MGAGGRYFDRGAVGQIKGMELESFVYSYLGIALDRDGSVFGKEDLTGFKVLKMVKLQHYPGCRN